MPIQTGPKSRVISRRIAPFAPLAVSILATSGLQGGSTSTPDYPPADIEPEQCANVTDMLDCHDRYPTGCSNAARPSYDAYLNFLKNKIIPPPTTGASIRILTESDFQELDSETPPGTALHKNDADELRSLGEGSIVGAIGYLYYAQVTGPESCNCQSGTKGSKADEDKFDYHIGIGFDANVATQLRENPNAYPKKDGNVLTASSIIVEMTPKYRYQFEQSRWTIDNVKSAVGRQVKVTGQLLVDSEHNVASQNCAIANGKDLERCWRKSVWEIHPVTQFLVCAEPSNSCAADSPKWVEIDRAAELSQ
jgi:hypothetical protein